MKPTGLGMMGPPGRQCYGDGTCEAARLNKAETSCKECGCQSWDHETGTPQTSFCVKCGALYKLAVVAALLALLSACQIQTPTRVITNIEPLSDNTLKIRSCKLTIQRNYGEFTEARFDDCIITTVGHDNDSGE